MTAQAKACAQVARAPFYRNAATSSRSVKRWNPPSLMSYELMRSSALKAVAEAMSSHGSNVGGDATASLMANPRKWERLQLHGLAQGRLGLGKIAVLVGGGWPTSGATWP